MPKVSIREPIHNELQARYPNLNTSEAVACALSELTSLRLLIQTIIGKVPAQNQPAAVAGAVALSSSIEG